MQSINAMEQVDTKYDSALRSLMKWADAEATPDIEVGWPSDLSIRTAGYDGGTDFRLPQRKYLDKIPAMPKDLLKQTPRTDSRATLENVIKQMRARISVPRTEIIFSSSQPASQSEVGGDLPARPHPEFCPNEVWNP